MKNPALPIRIGVITALETVLPDTPIRDTEAGPDDALPYVLLSTQTDTPDSTKTSFGTQSTLLIQVVGKKTLTVNRGPVDTILDTIMQKLIPQRSSDYITVTGFQVVQTMLDSTPGELITYETDGVSVTKQARIRFILHELN